MVVFAAFLDWNDNNLPKKPHYHLLPSLPDQAKALAEFSRPDLLNALVSAFLDFSSESLSQLVLRSYLRRWLSDPWQRRFLEALISTKLHKHHKLRIFAVGVLSYGDISWLRRLKIPPVFDEGSALHPQATTILTEELFKLGPKDLTVACLNQILHTVLDYPVPELIFRLIERGASVRNLDGGLPYLKPVMGRAAALQHPSVAALLLNNDANSDEGLMPTIQSYIEASKLGNDTTKAESLLYLLLSHKADPNWVILKTKPLTIAEHAMSQCSTLGKIFCNWVNNEISCEVMKIFETPDDITLINSSVAAKEIVLLAISRHPSRDRGFMKRLLHHGAHPNLLSLSAQDPRRQRVCTVDSISTTSACLSRSELLQIRGTPIDWACRSWDGQAARLLLEAGSSPPAQLLRLGTNTSFGRDWTLEKPKQPILPRWSGRIPDLSMFHYCHRMSTTKASKFMQEISGLVLKRSDLKALLRPCLLQWAFSEESLGGIERFLGDGVSLQDTVRIGDGLGCGSPLLLALQHCTLDFVELLWKSGVNFGHTEGEMPGSHELVRLCSWDLRYCTDIIPKVSFLLQKGARVNGVHNVGDENRFDIGPLQAALGAYAYGQKHPGNLVCCFEPSRNSEILERLTRYLVDLGADVDASNSLGPTPLQLAILTGNLKIIRSLVENGADVNLVRYTGLSVVGFSHPLVMVCAADRYLSTPQKFLLAEDISEELEALNQVEAAKLLIARGADVNFVPEGGDGALLQACSRGALALVKLLVANRANVHARSGRDGLSPLERTCRSVHDSGMEIALLLLENGALPDAANLREEVFDSNLRQALFRNDISSFKARFSVLVRSRKLAQNLRRATTLEIQRQIDLGVDLNYKTLSSGDTLLTSAIDLGMFSVSLLLIENGADVHATNSKGQTALHVAIWSGHYDLVRLLLNAGAIIDTGCEQYRRACQCAELFRRTHIVDLLEQWSEGREVKDTDQSRDEIEAITSPSID